MICSIEIYCLWSLPVGDWLTYIAGKTEISNVPHFDCDLSWQIKIDENVQRNGLGKNKVFMLRARPPDIRKHTCFLLRDTVRLLVLVKQAILAPTNGSTNVCVWPQRSVYQRRCEEMGLDSVGMCVSSRSALSFLHSLLDRGLSHVTTKFYAAANSSSSVGFGNPFLSRPLARPVQ